MYKHMILAMTLVFTTACSIGFNGDKWAQKQMELTADIAACVKLIETDIKMYESVCSGSDLASRAKASVVVLSDAMAKYPQGTATEEFLTGEFDEPQMGMVAIASMTMTITGLQYITTLLELDLAKKQLELELKKAKEEAGLRPA